MNRQSIFTSSAIALLLGFTVSMVSTVVAAQERPIVVIHTFDVHANAEGFMDIIDRAIKLSKKVDPEGGGSIRVLAGHVDGESASMITVATTYDNMDDYASNLEVMQSSPELQAVYKEMQAANFKIVHRSINTLIADY